MVTFRSSRLEALLGCHLDRIDRSALERLVSGAAEEDYDLDFKATLYGPNDKDKGELAKDVAAMADRGGLIVLGVDETDGTAGGLVDVEVDDGQANRMHQIVADRVMPMPEFSLLPVRNPQGLGQWVFLVPPSSLAPHAVRWRGEAGLRYFARNGRTTRELTESEIADRYRARFRSEQDRMERLEAAEAEGLGRLNLVGQSWLAVTLMPDRAGGFPLSAATLEAHRKWSENWQASTLQSNVDVSANRSQTVGFRRLIVSADLRGFQGTSSAGHYELHTDGVAFGAVALGIPIEQAFPNRAPETGKREHLVDQGELGLAVLDMLSLLSSQATEFAGASGDCRVVTRLVAGGDTDLRIEQRPLQLWEEHVKAGPRRVPGTRDVREPSRSAHTFSLGALTSNTTDLVVAARAVMLDLLSEFGQAGWNGWTEDGLAVPEHFGRNRQAYAAQWIRARVPSPPGDDKE